jgi:hypothetical protein
MKNVIEKARFSLNLANESQFEEVASFNNVHDSALRETAWLHWKYIQNPDGRGRLYVLRDAFGVIAGTVGYIPKPYDNKTNSDALVYQLVDGFVAPQFRKKGFFNEMLVLSQRDIKGPVLAFPNELARKTPLKTGFKLCSRIDIWTFPLDPIFAVMKRNNTFLKLFSRIFHRCYKLIFLNGNSRKIAMEPVVRFDKHFEDSESRIRKHIRAEFLNWRFVDNPLRSYVCYHFLLDNAPIGYCVFTIEGMSIELFDFVAENFEKACFRALAHFCWEKGQTHIVYPGAGLHLQKLGFIKRSGYRRFVLLRGRLPLNSGIIKLRDSDW